MISSMPIGKKLSLISFFFFNDTATTEIYTLSLHDALPISNLDQPGCADAWRNREGDLQRRSEEHTSELQSPYDIVCRLLLEKKKKHTLKIYIKKKKKNKKKKLKNKKKI